MGKSKDDHKLKRSSPSPRYESRSKRHRSSSKDDDKEHKSSKKHKSHSKEEKSSGKRKHKAQKANKLSKLIKIQELSDEDYFSKNKEFATWLKEEKNTFFNDLSSEAARSLFSKFVAVWNNRELEPQYYEGISIAPRTSHKWNIKK